MKIHWKILLFMAAGALLGGVFQAFLDAPAWIGVTVEDTETGVRIKSLDSRSPAAKADVAGSAKLKPGEQIAAIIRNRGKPGQEEAIPVRTAGDLDDVLSRSQVGDLIWIEVAGKDRPVSVNIAMQPGCQRDRWLEPFRFVADIFLALLKMLIVPVVLTSIITGVSGVGSGRDFGRLGGKTFGYYVSTSFLAIFTGLILVNVIRPGTGAELGLTPSDKFEQVAEQGIFDVFRRMVPENVFSAFSANGQMLQVIFFALLFGFFITRAPEPHRTRMREFFQSAFEVMMKMAVFILSLIPYGVLALLVKVVGETGFGMFRALAVYVVTVALGLIVHSCVVLPLLLRFVGGISPWQWFKAMGPALMTAFSTSSSSMTLPVSMEAVEKRGKVSNKTTSFVLPLGATINMDGTALYECVGVIFLAQFYATVGDFQLTVGNQVFVVVMALMASIGAAGIPSAGLVMMLTILTGLGLPVEGAALLLAVDRPLDMMRTMVNVWSDSCGAAIIARTEGEGQVAGIPAPG